MASSRVGARRHPTPAEVYRRFAADVAATSPLYGKVATALSESEDVQRVLAAVPARSRHPALVLAGLHDLVLAGRAPALAAAYAAGEADAAARAATSTLVDLAAEIAAVVAHRRVRPDETNHGAVLYPAVAEAAHRLGATAVGLVDVGCSAGFDLTVDRVGISYDGQRLGDPSSPVQLSASVAGDRPVPTREVPDVVARVGIDLDPLDVTDAADARWLRACLPPDQPDRRARLDAQLALAVTVPVDLLRGDPVGSLPDALARVPADALPVVTTTWTLSRLPPQRRLQFLQRLEEAAAHRPLAWVSAEGVGVAPQVPTLGDRHASGHSILGLAVLDGSRRDVEAVGRCWSRGRVLAWLADPRADRRSSEP